MCHDAAAARCRGGETPRRESPGVEQLTRTSDLLNRDARCPREGHPAPRRSTAGAHPPTDQGIGCALVDYAAAGLDTRPGAVLIATGRRECRAREPPAATLTDEGVDMTHTSAAPAADTCASATGPTGVGIDLGHYRPAQMDAACARSPSAPPHRPGHVPRPHPRTPSAGRIPRPHYHQRVGADPQPGALPTLSHIHIPSPLAARRAV